MTLSKLRVRPNNGGGQRIMLEVGGKRVPGPTHNGKGLTKKDKEALAEKDGQKVKEAAWDGITADELGQLVRNLHPRRPACKRPAAKNAPRWTMGWDRYQTVSSS